VAHVRRTPAGNWQVRYRDPAGIERARTFSRKGDAEKFMVTIEADKLRGLWSDPNLARTTINEWLPTWQTGRVHLRASTRESEASLLRNHVLPYFGTKRLGAVAPNDVQQFVASLQEKGLSPATIRLAYMIVQGMFSTAVESDLIPRSPCRGIKLPQSLPTEMRFLTTEEVSLLADAIDRQYRAFILTAAYTGCRFGELAGLRRHRLDLARRTLTVAESLTEVNGYVHVTPPKTAAGRRRIALPQGLCKELAEHLEEWPPSPDGLVFTAQRSGPLLNRNFRDRIWLPAVRASVGEPMRFHDLRHTHAAILIAQGEHPKVIQHRLGHSSIKITLDTYGHLFEGLDEAAAERLNVAFSMTLQDSCQRTRRDQVLDQSI
jgi:integrase